MNIFRAPLIAALMMISGAAFAQQGTVRVITGDIEHIYGPGGQILDDDALRARNEHAERMRQIERDRQDAIRRQEELDATRADAAPAYDDPYGAQDGSYYVGTFRSRHNRHINLRRMSTVGAVSGNSLQFRHANARVRR